MKLGGGAEVMWSRRIEACHFSFLRGAVPLPRGFGVGVCV